MTRAGRARRRAPPGRPDESAPAGSAGKLGRLPIGNMGAVAVDKHYQHLEDWMHPSADPRGLVHRRGLHDHRRPSWDPIVRGE